MTVAVVAACVLAAVALWRLALSRVGRWDRAREAVRARLSALGAKPVSDDIWSFEGRRYRVSVGPPGLLTGRADLRIGLFTPVMRARAAVAAGTPGPAGVEGEVVRRFMPGRWGRLSVGPVELSFEDARISAEKFEASELRGALCALRELDAVPPARAAGGVLTLRTGFEPDIAPWHWTAQLLDELPPGTRRFAVAWTVSGRGLGLPLVEILIDLAAGARPCFIVDARDLSFLEHAFGGGFRRRGTLLECRDARVVEAADAYLDGAFMRGFLALPGGDPGADLEGIRAWQIPALLVKNLRRVRFFARRLLDGEGSWHSGEIEIVSLELSPEEVSKAVEAAAARAGASVSRISAPFCARIFAQRAGESNGTAAETYTVWV